MVKAAQLRLGGLFSGTYLYTHIIQFLYKCIRGVVLVSGFSKSIVDMVVSRELDPERALKAELDAKCSIVDTALQGYVKVA